MNPAKRQVPVIVIVSCAALPQKHNYFCSGIAQCMLHLQNCHCHTPTVVGVITVSRKFLLCQSNAAIVELLQWLESLEITFSTYWLQHLIWTQLVPTVCVCFLFVLKLSPERMYIAWMMMMLARVQLLIAHMTLVAIIGVHTVVVFVV